jgi:hypothetical protein
LLHRRRRWFPPPPPRVLLLGPWISIPWSNRVHPFLNTSFNFPCGAFDLSAPCVIKSKSCLVPRQLMNVDQMAVHFSFIPFSFYFLLIHFIFKNSLKIHLKSEKYETNSKKILEKYSFILWFLIIFVTSFDIFYELLGF